MRASDVRAHPSARRARTCPHLASSWQLLSHKGAQMTSAEPQNDTIRRPNGQKTRPRRPRLTTFVPELVSTDLPPTTNQPTNQHIKDQGFALLPVGWPVTSPQASSIRPPHRCRVKTVVLQGLHGLGAFRRAGSPQCDAAPSWRAKNTIKPMEFQQIRLFDPTEF